METKFTMMLKVKPKLPDRLGSLVVGFEEKDEESGGSNSIMDSGEELEAIQHFGLRPASDSADGFLEEKVKMDEKLDSRVKLILDRNGSFSVLEALKAEDKISNLEYELGREEINLEKLQRIAATGLPYGLGLRATVWKLLLGYLPPSRDSWEKELKESREKYAKLKEELLLSPSDIKSMKEEQELNTNVDSEFSGPLRRKEISQEDHPLSLGKGSLWRQYFQHTEISEQIDRDLQRTHPDIKFFSGDTSFSRKHRERMKSILLLFAKLNPVIHYVQGMNEVLAPIYYLFSTDPDEQNAANAEADSFSCFVRLLSDLVDHFCEQLDNSSSGILSTLSRLSDLLKANDVELWKHLEITSMVKPQYYGFRWITLLLTQEFDLHSIFRIWDTLLSNQFGIQDMLLRVCCAMILCVKTRILNGDFAANLKLLQHYPQDISVEHILRVASDLSPDTSSYRLSL